MKYSAALTVFTLAATALAAPAEFEVRTTPTPPKGDVCTNNSKQVCCNGILNCLVQVVGAPCNSGSYCCKTSAPTGALINVALLNCVNILG